VRLSCSYKYGCVAITSGVGGRQPDDALMLGGFTGMLRSESLDDQQRRVLQSLVVTRMSSLTLDQVRSSLS
jgi:hypothetical protein